MPECLFCKIISGDIPAKKAYDDDQILAFHDINPQAPVHILIIPKKHIPTVGNLEDPDYVVVGKMIKVAKTLAAENNITASGFRLVFNNNKDAGQVVFHLHLHLLGGRKFTWPPG